jgi:tetratricopeptide (TPR) repeat protein
LSEDPGKNSGGGEGDLRREGGEQSGTSTEDMKGRGGVTPVSPPTQSPPATVVPAFASDDELAWEFELAAWDAAVPIVARAPQAQGRTPSPATRTTADAPTDELGPFEVTPTVVKPLQLLDLDDLPEMLPATSADDAIAPASGPYPAFIAIDGSAPSIFESDPVAEEPPQFPTDTLREMSADPWSQDLGQLVALGFSGRPAAPPPAYWETFGQVVAAELGTERDRDRVIALDLAAARVAELQGQPKAAWAYVDAALSRDGSSPAAHRARLGLLERRGQIVDDEAAAESITRLALTLHPDQAYYRSLQAEWILARSARGRVEGTAAALITGAPEGLGRILAEAELTWGEPPVAAAILEAAAQRVGGSVGAALLVCAAGLNEIAHDFETASERRQQAARLDDGSAPAAVGLIRDVARLEAEAVVPALEQLVKHFPPSSLKVSLARWGAAAAQRRGDADRAWRFVAEPSVLGSGGISAALARDRLDLWPGVTSVASGKLDVGGGIGALIESVAGSWPSSTARMCLALRACEFAVDPSGIHFAIAAVEESSAAGFDASILGPAIEALSHQAGDVSDRVRALQIWRRVDPARWLSGSLDLADVWAAPAQESGNSQGPDTREAVLAEIAASQAVSPVFWQLATLRSRRGAFAEAATMIDQALAKPWWGSSPLATPLAELASELVARTDLRAGAARLEELHRVAMDTPGSRLTLTRMLRTLEDRERWTAHVRAEIDSPLDSIAARERSVALSLAPSFWSTRIQGEDASLASRALDLVPLHPSAFGLFLASRPDPSTLIDILVASARAGAGQGWLLTAAIGAASRGDPRRALSLAIEACAVATAAARKLGDEGSANANAIEIAQAARATVRDLTWAGADIEQRGQVLRGLAEPGGQSPVIVEAAEAEEQAGHRSEAIGLFERAAAAPTHAGVLADIRAGLARLATVAGVAVEANTQVSSKFGERLGPLAIAARAGRWEDLVARLMEAPPHAETADASILVLAAEIDEGRASGARSREIWARARTLTGRNEHELPGRAPELAEPGILLRVADREDADPGEARAALEQLAEIASSMSDERSATLFLIEAAEVAAGADAYADAGTGAQIEPMAPPSVPERCLRAAVTRDPTSAPAAMAWRRWLVRAGRIDDAADVSAAESQALIVPALRVQSLVRAAAILSGAAEPVASSEGPARLRSATRDDRVRRSVAFLRRALAISPGDHDAFTRLRDLYERAGQHAELVDLLGTRLAATTNPFEVTALHLARSEIFAVSLGDPRRAKIELEAILHKEPQHARALGSLAEIEADEGNHVVAADLLIRRAFIERSPEKLQELFLRLGRIYTQHAPDPKRAVGAYTRVLQLDVNNREALDELSKLYLGLGETKSAIAITERLVRMEGVAEKRAAYHIRLGHIAERAVDPRGAAHHFRRAAEEAPRNIEAVGELARYLEKARDTVGRRAYLDRAATELRAAVIADPDDRSATEVLSAVMRWRGRTAAAAAAADLVALLGSRSIAGGQPAPLADWALPPTTGRRLAALTKPSVDEQTFDAAVPPSVRQLFLILGPILGDLSRSDAKLDLARYGIDRADRIAPGHPPRDILESVAAELAAGPFDLYIAPPRLELLPVPLVVEPGKPAVIVIGSELLKLGPQAVRFIAGRTLRLVSTHLDLALAGGAVELGAWLAGVIRQFVVDYRHPDVPAEVIAARAARVAKLLPRRLRQEVMPFAMETSGELDLEALRAGIRDGVNRVGLVASGSLGAALRVVLCASTAAGAIPSAASIKENSEARALLTFALSDEHDELVRSLE